MILGVAPPLIHRVDEQPIGQVCEPVVIELTRKVHDPEGLDTPECYPEGGGLRQRIGIPCPARSNDDCTVP